MSSRDTIKLLDSTMSIQEIPGWKLEINHDGVILNWYSAPTSKSISKEIPSISSESKTESESKSKTNLIDYLYVVSDGVVFSGNTDM
jgi:hypothetical protein